MYNKLRFNAISYVLFVFNLVIVGCSNPGSVVEQSQQAKTPVPSASQAPSISDVVGKYSNTSDPDLITELKNDGTFTQESRNKSVVGKYSIKGNFVYFDEVITLNGKPVPEEAKEKLKEIFSKLPAKIDGRNLQVETATLVRQEADQPTPAIIQESSSQDVVGKYVDKTNPKNIYEFKNDGTYTGTFNNNSASGKYNVRENRLYMEVSSVNGVAISEAQARAINEKASAYPLKIDGRNLISADNVRTFVKQ
jgi:hypothetical protein